MGKIKNIIFDLGGVIFDLDYQLTEDAFVKLGARDFGAVYSKIKQNPIFDDFEKGNIGAKDFRVVLSKLLNINVSDAAFDNAWSAILLGWNKEKLDFATSLKNDYRIFILSNTNDIHFPKVFNLLKENIGLDNLDTLFEKTYYSNSLHLRKPDTEIFNLAIEENNLIPSETLFVDDIIHNIEGAKKVGLQGFHVTNKKTVKDIISIL